MLGVNVQVCGRQSRLGHGLEAPTLSADPHLVHSRVDGKQVVLLLPGLAAFCLHLLCPLSPPAANALYCYTCDWQQSNWSCLKAQKCSDKDEYCVTNVASVGIGMCRGCVSSDGDSGMGCGVLPGFFMVALCGWIS